EAMADPEVRDFAAKVSIVGDAELSRQFEGRQPARVKVWTQAGEVFEKLVGAAKGSPGSPLSSAELDTKFRSQAADVYGAENSEKSLSQLRGSEELDDVAQLAKLLVCPKF